MTGAWPGVLGKDHTPFWSSAQIGPEWGSAGGVLHCRRGASPAALRPNYPYYPQGDQRGRQAYSRYPRVLPTPRAHQACSSLQRREDIGTSWPVLWAKGRNPEDVPSIRGHAPESIYHLCVKHCQHRPFAQRDCPRTSSGSPYGPPQDPLQSPTV